jgi:L-threonylcarbamoyladenylate synthase
MEILSEKSKSVVKKATEVLREGGVIAYPTDTAYGLGVDATNDEAISRLYKIKNREGNKPTHVVVSDIDMANHYVVFNKEARMLAKVFLPGPLTIILKNKGRVSKRIVGENGTLGIRMPNSEFIQSLVKEFRLPITTTSANKTGDPAPYSVDEIKNSFGEDFEKIDLVIDGGELKRVLPSTLVDLSRKEIKVLREGPINKEEILKVLE